MLSTVNQHKSSMKTESVRSITLVSKAASRFSLSNIPEFVYSALPISIALSMGLVLVGCGAGNNPTTRTQTPTPPSSTARTSYNLTVQSPVLLKNIKVTVTDTSTGAVIVQSVIQSGNEAVLEIPLAYLQTDHVIMITLSPIDNTSIYFDPLLNNALGAMTGFNQSLHGLITMNNKDKVAKVDPFSEIIYQRALIRSGTLDISKPNLNTLTTSQLTSANNEMTMAFGTDATKSFSVFFNNPTSIAAINLYDTVAGVAYVNGQASSTVSALGQMALYVQNNSTDSAPYLNFAARAGLDMRDGDLDGMTTVGGENINDVLITNPILYSGIVSEPNIDPDNTNLVSINTQQRKQRGIALTQATKTYFDTINASVPQASRTDSASLDYISKFDFGAEAGTRVGAGNYTLTFGLPTSFPTDGDGNKIKKALDASEASGRSHDIMQLNGTYLGSGGCQLNIGYDGTIQLNQGTLSFTTTVSRKFSDSLRQYPTGSNQYILNAASADLTAPRFIQIKTIGAHVVSAEAGRSTEQFPITLSTTELHCDF